MAGDWIKMRTDLDEDPVVVALAARLKVSEYVIIGCLWKLWSIANEQTSDGHLAGYTPETLDKKVNLPGFSACLTASTWLISRSDSLEIPNFQRHNGTPAKTRAANTSRQKSCRASGATEARPEKRREEKRRVKKEPPLIPPALDTQKFRAAWGEWIAYRQTKRKPVSDDAARKQFATLEPFGPDVGVEAISMSIRNDWQGLFPEKCQRQTAPKNETVGQRIDRLRKETPCLNGSQPGPSAMPPPLGSLLTETSSCSLPGSVPLPIQPTNSPVPPIGS